MLWGWTCSQANSICPVVQWSTCITHITTLSYIIHSCTHTQDGAGWSATCMEWLCRYAPELSLSGPIKWALEHATAKCVSILHSCCRYHTERGYWYTGINYVCCAICSPPQAHQEQAYQKFCATKAVEKAQQQERYYEQGSTKSACRFMHTP